MQTNFRHLYYVTLHNFPIVFGRYTGSFSLHEPDFLVGLKDHGSSQLYYRQCCGTSVEKILSQKNNILILNPVEPVNLPQEITPRLEIAFSPVVLPAGAQKQVFLKFPVEIGVFLETDSVVSVLDIFSLVPAKYSLYGTPGTGLITRWYYSEVHDTLPPTDPVREGALCLTLNNHCTSAIEVGRTLLESYSMCLFYGDRVGMTVTMDIISPALAETTFAAVPGKGCETRSLDLYAARKFAVVPRKTFTMESGVL